MISKSFFDENIDRLIDCVKLASNEIMDIYRSDNLGQEEKMDGSPLTLADKRSNEIILNSLEAISKDIKIISEETFTQDALKNLDETYWLVDPLDGTKEFINQTGEFTVNIAMINQKQPMFGIVAAPVTGKIWYGSIFENIKLKDGSVKKLRIVMSKSHKSDMDDDFLNFLESKNIDYEIVEKGSSLKLCTLADNEADIYPRFGPTSEWDIAAAHAVLSSKGGSVIRIEDNKELVYAKKDTILNPYFIAFRNNSIKNDFLPVLGDFFKKLV